VLDALPDVVPRLPRPGGIGPVPRPGRSTPGLFLDPDQPHGPGRDRGPAGPGHAAASVADALRPPPPHRAHRAPDMGLRLGHGRDRVLDALPALRAGTAGGQRNRGGRGRPPPPPPPPPTPRAAPPPRPPAPPASGARPASWAAPS